MSEINMEVNINDTVTVKLTENGIRVIAMKCPCLLSSIQNNELMIQLWDLMNIFGSEMCVGGKALFEDNRIRFEGK